MNYLTIDFGNSLIKFGLFKNQELFRVEKCNYEEAEKKIIFFFEQHQIDQTIYCSVKNIDHLLPILTRIKAVEFSVSEFPFLEHDYTTPNSLGNDRYLAAMAANRIFKNKNCLVVDIGTAITYDFVSKENLYKGGAIAPGLQLRFNSLHDYTSQLPLIKFSGQQPQLIGTSTHDSILSGVINGIIHEISGTITRYEEEHEEIKTIFTGGDGQFFADAIKNSIFVYPNLMLEGLHTALQRKLN